MPQATPHQRLEVLTRWRTEAAAAGHPVPSDDFARELSEAGSHAKSFLESTNDSAVAAWAPTLNFFVKQWKMSVILPDLPNHLKAPADSAAAPTPVKPAAVVATSPPPNAGDIAAPSLADARFEALKAWRTAAIESGAESVGNIRESTLRRISGSEVVTEPEVAPFIPASLSGFAGDIAGVLGGIASKSTSVAAVAAAPRAAIAPPPPALPSTDAQAAAGPEMEPTFSASSTTAPVHDVAPEGYEGFDFSRASEEVLALRGSGTEQTGLLLAWDALSTADPVVLYRVVSGDQYAPFNPDTADLVISTAKTSVKDSRPFGSAVRHLQVWANSGTSVEESKASQPVLHAHASFVAPPRRVEIRVDEKKVIGQWETWPETTRVLIFRVPRERAAQESMAPQHQILSGSDNLGGFVDSDPDIRGKCFLYQTVAEAPVDGTRQRSVPVVQIVDVPDVLEPVLDLVIKRHGDEEPQFDLTWTTPKSGQVAIYRTEQSPQAGVDRRALSESALEQAGLVTQARLAHPISRSIDGTAEMLDVPWPREWKFAYFTPVTLLNGQAFVGTSVAAVDPPRIKIAKIVERVNKQILTFEWPQGAASVFVYEGVTDQAAEVATQSNQAHEITQEQYVQQGGLTFPRPLSPKGCDIHLVAVAFLAGQRVVGPPATVRYDRLFRLRYDVRQLRGLTGTITAVSVTLRSEEEMSGPPGFVLVHNPDRMPLSKADGRVLTVAPEAVEGSPRAKRMGFSQLGNVVSKAWRTPADTWKLEVGKPRGYVRVFADLPPDGNVLLALVDPAPSTLRLESLMGRIGGLIGG
ncbi:putative ESX-1 scaffolding and assembly protein SaeA [Salinibacterium xinjiangense]|uniref:Uncharacterized protein n=1 Tax=Salinibacterium xinjiangense TaxID=386302 RepID=A0A2C8YT50_9MICO|nr:hypothetical protein [Salinibacterium xinjiangense]GGK99782.1 putative ESX-1 scaffolding and assembly protein SaeA [Salinibacterium xinjiangense]SOE53860.1 hypothetical protein SAMN06296378_0620 [Salinibacterium xinjiangense]